MRKNSEGPEGGGGSDAAEQLAPPRVAAEIDLARHELPEGYFLPEKSLPHAFTVISNRVSQTLQTMYSEKFGLTVAGWRIMAILGTHSPLSAKALAEMTAMDQVSTSRALEQLSNKKLLSRRVDPSDRRRVVLRLNRKGQTVFRQIVPVLYAAERALIDGFTEEEVATIRRYMTQLMERSARHMAEEADWRALVERYGHGGELPPE